MGKSKGCKIGPIINGDISKLYKDLFDLIVSKGVEALIARLLTNVLYIKYKVNLLFLDYLDNSGFLRNSQDEHEALDVFTEINGDDIIVYSNFTALDTLCISEGIKLDTVTDAEFDDWSKAYQKAYDINVDYDYLSAYVIYKNNKWVVKVNRMSTINVVDRLRTDIEDSEMILISKYLNQVNSSITFIEYEQESFFGSKWKVLSDWIYNTSKTNPKYLLKRDLKMLISLFQNLQIVDRLLTKFGGVDNLVDIYYDWYRNNYAASPTTEVLLKTAMDLMHSFNNMDIDKFRLDVTQTLLTIEQTSEDNSIYTLFNKLNKKFNLIQVSIEVNKNDLSSLSKILSYTLTLLGNEYTKIKDDKSNAYKDLYILIINELENDLENKTYTKSLSDFLVMLSDRLLGILYKVSTVIPLGADISFILERGKTYNNARQLLDVYQQVMDRIITLNNLDIDIQISNPDVTDLITKAKQLNDNILKIKEAINRGLDEWAKLAISFMMAENSEITINEVMETISKDVSWVLRLYNPVNISNIPAAVLTNYIQTARRQRTKRLAEISQRIASIAERVGFNTEFMYEPLDTPFGKQYIIANPYDWNLYYKKKSAYKHLLEKRGYTGIALQTEITKWVERNTDEVIVDKNNGRTERFPKFLKKTSKIDGYTNEQLDAYKEFLDLKAEIESMLPAFAQSYYRPPLVRKSAIDKLTSSGNLLKGIKEAIKEKYLLSLGVREDEVGLGLVIDTSTGEVALVNTNLKGTQDIVPINYIQELSNQEELLQNFAEALSKEAASAVNYDSMSEIMDTVEVLCDYIEGKVSPQEEGIWLARGFTINNKTFFEKLFNSEETNVESILKDQKQRMLYNNNTAGRSMKAAKNIAFLKRITSINALTFNIMGGQNNALEAVRKSLENAFVANKTFGPKDFIFGIGRLLYGNIGKFPIHLLDFFANKKRSLEALLAERFDVTKEKFRAIENKKFRSNWFRKIFSYDASMALYAWGETLGKTIILYSTLHAIKVKINNQKKSLFSAFVVKRHADGSYYLGIKDNVYLENGLPVTDMYIDLIAKEMNSTAEEVLGGMSDEAMGLLGTTIIGAMTLHLRRWMIGVYSAYFRGTWYDAATGKKKTGAYAATYLSTLLPIIKALLDCDGHLPWSKNWQKDFNTFIEDVLINYKSLKRHLIAGLTRFITSTVLMTLLSVLTDASLRYLYPKYGDEEWFKILYYFLVRLKMDVTPTAPDLNHIVRMGQIGSSIIEIADKPYASASTVKDYYGLIANIDLAGTEILKGPHKGEDKYWRHVRRTLWKPGEMYNRLRNVEDTNELIESLGGMLKYSIQKEYEKLIKEEEDSSATGIAIINKKGKKKRKVY